jgi:hypothetical protein
MHPPGGVAGLVYPLPMVTLGKPWEGGLSGLKKYFQLFFKNRLTTHAEYVSPLTR